MKMFYYIGDIVEWTASDSNWDVGIVMEVEEAGSANYQNIKIHWLLTENKRDNEHFFESDSAFIRPLFV